MLYVLEITSLDELNFNIGFYGARYFDWHEKKGKNLLSNIPQPHDKYS